MDRRTFLLGLGGGLGSAGVAGGVLHFSGGNSETQNTTENTTEEPPEAAKESKPLATDFYKTIKPYFKDVHVYVRQNGEIDMQYVTTASGGSAVKAEFHQIAKEYGTLVKAENYDPKTLTIRTGEAKALVPISSLQAYADGEIEEEAYIETVEVL